MNRGDKSIAKRLARGGRMPTAFAPWEGHDWEICPCLLTKPADYTKKGRIVIFEHGKER